MIRTIEHDDTCNKRLSESCGQGDKTIIRKAASDDFVLIVPLGSIRRVDIGGSSIRIKLMFGRSVALVYNISTEAS